jgi:deoxyribodipyrimidine photo-lyase
MAEKDGFNSRRCRILTKADGSADTGPVIYWMWREQRVEDNWALIHAQRLATKRKQPLFVAFCLVPKYLDSTIRHFHFMLAGLQEVEASLKAKHIPFFLQLGSPKDEIPKLCAKLKATTVVCDMTPLRTAMNWAIDVAKACDTKGISCHQVDAHNIVPVWVASDKLEYAARTIRPKITKLLPEFLTEFPTVSVHKYAAPKSTWPRQVDWKAAEKSLKVDRTVSVVKGFVPGSAAARKRLAAFCKADRLKMFETGRNDPTKEVASGLSPYIHFGQIAPQRCALSARACGKAGGKSASKASDAFIEELVIRREVADNFTFYNPHYDSLQGCTDWAQISLKKHEKDKRLHVYSRQQLEAGKTHDDLWNASQLQLVQEGKMHGFLRMYWAKKILEWSATPQEALANALYLNDRFNLDGTDPNGYTGVMWSVGGVHDMGWAERPIFGKIRYMNYEGCKRKFNVPSFVARYCGSPAAASSSSEVGKGTKRASSSVPDKPMKKARKP